MDARSARTRSFPVLLAIGVVLVAINLRPTAASVGPVLGRIQSDVGLSSGWAGVLTTLPVLCFGLLAPLAPPLARRWGIRSSIAGAMVIVLAGQLIRLIPGVGFLFFGTALAGAAIATGNVLMPALIRRDFFGRAGAAMTLFTTSLVGFTALCTGVTVPLADALGGGWRPGLAIWAIPALVCVLAWLPALTARDASSQGDSAEDRRTSSQAASETIRALLRSPLAWQVTLFFGAQSAIFYANLSWLPSIFRSHGASEAHAGLLLSISIVVGLFTAVTVPGLAARLKDQRPLVVACCVLTGAGLGGILLAPMSAPYLWTVLLGLGQNAAFPLALMIIIMRGGDVATTESLSALAQSVGYLVGALGPLAVGALHGMTNSWTPALILLLVLVVPELVIGLAAARDRQLSGPNQSDLSPRHVIAGHRL